MVKEYNSLTWNNRTHLEYIISILINCVKLEASFLKKQGGHQIHLPLIHFKCIATHTKPCLPPLTMIILAIVLMLPHGLKI